MQDSAQEVSDEPEPGSENERRAKLFRLKNRLARQPGDLELIEEYVGLVLDSTSQEDGAEELETYDRLEGFLLSRAEDVEPEEVDALLDMADKLDERREKVLQQSEPDVQVSEADQKVVEAYEEWREDGIDTTVPEDPEEAEQKLSLSEAVQALIRDQDREPLDGLESLIDQLQVATQADRSLSRVEQIIESAENESDSSQAAYTLQSAEQTIQQLVTKRGDLGSARRDRIHGVVQDFESASNKITKVRRSEEDQRRWESFSETHKEDLEGFESWNPEQSTYSFKDTPKYAEKIIKNEEYRERVERTREGIRAMKKLADTIGKSDIGISEDKSKEDKKTKSRNKNKDCIANRRHVSMTKKIDRLKSLVQELSRVGEEMRTLSGQEMVQEKVENLSETLESAQQKREQVYNEFALALIRKCFSEAEEATGTWDDNKPEIANQLVEYLGEVDQRFLTSEVGRCYSEVFEHLYGKLDRVEGEDGFKEEGRKLNVLKRMHETEAVGIEAF